MYALEANSPQSQKLPVASMVIRYTAQAIIHITQPVMLLMRLKLIICGCYLYPDNYRVGKYSYVYYWLATLTTFLDFFCKGIRVSIPPYSQQSSGYPSLFRRGARGEVSLQQ